MRRMLSCRHQLLASQRSTFHTTFRQLPLKYGSIRGITTDGEAPKSSRSIGQDETFRTRNRHLLRAILRECTYFPDRFAAKWLRQHALSKFYTYEGKAREHRNDDALDERLIKTQRKGRQALYQLQKANHGDRVLLFKALSMAYGRTGRRRRELLALVMSAEGTGDSRGADKSTRQADIVSSTEHDEKSKAELERRRELRKRKRGMPVDLISVSSKELLHPALYALAVSQIRNKVSSAHRPQIRRLKPDIPEFNAWKDPMPQVRVKNMTAAFRADLLDRLMPPLPAEQWHILRQLASGEVKFQGVIARRKRPSMAAPSALDRIVLHGKLDGRLIREQEAHKVKARFMRRIWTELFAQCPMMEYHPTKEEWVVTWGTTMAMARPTEYYENMSKTTIPLSSMSSQPAEQHTKPSEAAITVSSSSLPKSLQKHIRWIQPYEQNT